MAATRQQQDNNTPHQRKTKQENEKQLNINTARSSTPELVEHYIQNELGDGSHYLKAGKFLWEGLQKKKTPYISSTYQKLEDDSE